MMKKIQILLPKLNSFCLIRGSIWRTWISPTGTWIKIIHQKKTEHVFTSIIDFHPKNSAYLFLVNPQFVFFGYPSYLLEQQEGRVRALVDEWIKEIDKEFDLILILEQLTDSLALLVLKFCWDVRDVAHIKEGLRNNPLIHVTQLFPSN